MADFYRHMDGYDPPPADGPPAPYEYQEDPVSVEHRQHPERYDYDDFDAQADALLAAIPGDDMPLDWPGPGEPDAGHLDEPPRYEEHELDTSDVDVPDGFQTLGGDYDG